MERKITEIERIRKKFGASRKQFGNVFLGKSATIIKYYENGWTKTPECVLRLARVWEEFLDKMKNGNEEEK